MKKVFISIISIILTFSLCACAAESPNTPEPQPPTSETSDSPEPQPPISETPDSPKSQNLYEIAGMPAPFDGDGGDGHGKFIHWGNDKFMDIPGNFWERYVEFLGEREILEELREWEQARAESLTISYVTGLMDFQNIYSLAVINDISIEIVIAAMDEYNEFRKDLALELFGIVADEDSLPYTEEDKAALLTQDEETILRHFASPYAIVIGDKVYTPAWLYTHTPEDFRAVGITPEMIAEKLYLYAELNLTEEAITAFESKLSEFLETSVTINRTSSY